MPLHNPGTGVHFIWFIPQRKTWFAFRRIRAIVEHCLSQTPLIISTIYMASITSFEELGLRAPILAALTGLGYKTPTPIQAACIPLLLESRDIIGLAQTGTGKTAAFALPLIQRFSMQRVPLRKGKIRSLILSPTRELAQQIYDNIISYSRGLSITSSVMFGGVGYSPQTKALSRGLDILVATPGRLMDHMERGNVNLSEVEVLVLDEADRMLDMGFAPAIKKIAAKLPPQRHTQLFSATMPPKIRMLAEQMLRNPETVAVTPPTMTADKIEQSIYHVDTQADKKNYILTLLQETHQNNDRVLIFTRTKHGADRLAKFLTKNEFPSSAIHGDKTQGARERMLKAFKTGDTPILIATDLASRGIDVKGINLVINHDLPNEPEVYIHRIGRTARAGAEGQALSFCSPDEVPYCRDIQKLIGKRLPLHKNSGPEPRPLVKEPSVPASKSRSRRRDFSRRRG